MAYFVSKLFVQYEYLQYKLVEPGHKKFEVDPHCFQEVRKTQSIFYEAEMTVSFWSIDSQSFSRKKNWNYGNNIFRVFPF